MHGTLYVSDVHNRRVQSFPFTTEAGSPNGTTILSYSKDNATLIMSFMPRSMDVDPVRNLLYVIDGWNHRLVIVNVTDNNTQIIAYTVLTFTNSSTTLWLSGVLIDLESDLFYIHDSEINALVKFHYGSTEGSIVFKLPVFISGIGFNPQGFLYFGIRLYPCVIQVSPDFRHMRTLMGELFYSVTLILNDYNNSLPFFDYTYSSVILES